MDFMKKTLNQVNTQDNTLYDFIYDLIFFMSLKESEEDIKNGRVMTIEESKARLMQKYGNLNNNIACYSSFFFFRNFRFSI